MSSCGPSKQDELIAALTKLASVPISIEPPRNSRENSNPMGQALSRATIFDRRNLILRVFQHALGRRCVKLTKLIYNIRVDWPETPRRK